MKSHFVEMLLQIPIPILFFILNHTNHMLWINGGESRCTADPQNTVSGLKKRISAVSTASIVSEQASEPSKWKQI